MRVIPPAGSPGWAAYAAPGSVPLDLWGATFIVEGRIYPAGTLPEGATGVDPFDYPSTGVWLCHGWITIRPDRPNPHVVSTQEYLFGEVGPGAPATQLVSQGLEGTDVPGLAILRSIIGGTGTYAGARGTIFQRATGTNITKMAAGPQSRELSALPWPQNGPNLRFEATLG